MKQKSQLPTDHYKIVRLVLDLQIPKNENNEETPAIECVQINRGKAKLIGEESYALCLRPDEKVRSCD